MPWSLMSFILIFVQSDSGTMSAISSQRLLCQILDPLLSKPCILALRLMGGVGPHESNQVTFLRLGVPVTAWSFWSPTVWSSHIRVSLPCPAITVFLLER